MHLRRNSPSSFTSQSYSSFNDQTQSLRDLKPHLQGILRIVSAVYSPLRQYVKKQNKLPNELDIQSMYKCLKTTHSKLKDIIKKYPSMIEKQEQKQNNLYQQLANAKRRNSQLIEKNRFVQSQYHKKMIDIQQFYNKKQQDYQNLINSYVRSIIDARKVWSDFQNKIANLVTVLEQKSQIEQQVRQFYSTIISMIHSMSTKASINDSQIDQPCQMSSIIRHDGQDDLLGQDINYDEYDQEDVDAQLKRIEQSLKILASKGLFNKQNQQFLSNFIDLKQRFGWNEFTKTNYYNELLQFLKQGCNMQQSILEGNDNTIIQYNNQDSESLINYNSQNKFLGNFQQKVQDSLLEGASSLNPIDSDIIHQIDRHCFV